MTKAIIYARCSTDEDKQDVEVQFKELRRYCKAYDWKYDEVHEYESSYKGKQVKLYEMVEKIRRKEYQVLLVYSLDRFSRMHPRITEELLNRIVHVYGCRFIELQHGLDSKNELTWYAVRPLFQYFAHVYSRDMSQKVKQGIRRKKELGEYNGGRPRKNPNLAELLLLRKKYGSLRKIARAYNLGVPELGIPAKPRKERISHETVKKTLAVVSVGERG